jgi:hypothetical protein
MREYRMFLGTDAGVFGAAKRVLLLSDDVALHVARRLLNEVAGVDVWEGDRRVALLQRPPAAAPSRAKSQ